MLCRYELISPFAQELGRRHAHVLAHVVDHRGERGCFGNLPWWQTLRLGIIWREVHGSHPDQSGSECMYAGTDWSRILWKVATWPLHMCTDMHANPDVHGTAENTILIVQAVLMNE